MSTAKRVFRPTDLEVKKKKNARESEGSGVWRMSFFLLFYSLGNGRNDVSVGV
jgi:hypothetical protein